MRLEIFTAAPFVQNLGWTLAHSLWQGAFIALWLFAALKISAQASANLRYLLSCAALLLMLLLPAATSVWMSNAAGENQSPISNSEFQAAAAKRGEKAVLDSVAGQKAAAKIDFSNQPNSASFSSTADFQKILANVGGAILPYAVWFWLVGVAIFACRTAGGAWHLRVLRRTKISVASDEWQQCCAKLCEQIDINAAIRLCESALVNAPVVVGWLKPVILIPAGAFCGLGAAQLETIIVHELMHIRRQDYLVNLLQTAAEILLFYHPAAWWISAKIRDEREFACDENVVAFYGEPLNYAHALANLEQFRRAANGKQPQLTLAATGGKLMKRIQKIIGATNSQSGNYQKSLGAMTLAFLLVSAILVGIFSANSQFTADAQTAKAKTRKMAIGFVSIPPVDRTANAPKDSDATARLLIEKLKAHKIPAIGFVQGGMISDGEKLFPVRAEIVRTWRDAGFEIGIGGFRHIWFYDTPYDEYVQNVEKNERVTKQILAEKNLPLRYFSYPFLNTAKTAEDKGRFESWLAARNLKSVKYTFDNSEWMYSYAYDMARNDNDVTTMREVRAEYIDYMTKMTGHYEAYSQDLFGRDINQTMVLTSTRLVADTADEVFGMLEKRGYEFVSMDEAQADAAYNTPENFVGIKAGVSWMERWTLAQNKKLRDEPKVSERIERIWNERKPAK